jgi:hypothetical protein
MKRLLVVLVAIALCTVLSAVAKGEDPQTKSKPCEYTGTVKEKLEKPDRIVKVETQEGLKDFYFMHDGKKECNSWQELAIGDNVRVSCKKKKDRIEATCVIKIPTGTTLRGGTLKGGTIK